MAREKDKVPQESNPTDLVPVMFAANTTEAEFYQTLLADADIEAIIGTDEDETEVTSLKGLPIMVPADRLNEASDIITARDEMDEHILAGPDALVSDDDEEDDLTGPHIDDDTEDSLFFRREPFVDGDEEE